MQFNLPPSGKQVYIASFLAEVRSTGLHEAVKEAVRKVSAESLRSEMTVFAPADGLQEIQGTGVRDEEVFAVPSLLKEAPGTLAYYRLLLGVSQKQFYTRKTGLNIFRPMEARLEVPEAAEPYLGELCTVLNASMNALIHALPQGTLRKDVDQLPLLTLGSQADGSWRGQIGAQATLGVFAAMKAIVKQRDKPYTETDVSITVINNSNREVTLALAPDPDVVIREEVNDSLIYKAAIEIKGGADYSNIHNRVGEAEKSHQKARNEGAQDCWTIINLDRADMSVIRQESPTTREWFDVNEILAQEGASWTRLSALTISAMGI